MYNEPMRKAALNSQIVACVVYRSINKPQLTVLGHIFTIVLAAGRNMIFLYFVLQLAP